MGARFFKEVVCKVFNEPMWASASELIEFIDIDGPQNGTLGKLTILHTLCKEFNIEVVPPLSEGELTERRTVVIARPNLTSSINSFIEEASGGESARLEFKSTLRFDLRRASADPSVLPSQCESEEVVHSSLKTIAAFLNCDGGVLFVGVDDAGTPCGLDQDFLLPGTPDVDRWEQFLRNLIDTRFKDGKTVGTHVKIRPVCEGGKTVCRIEVVPRIALSYVKRKGGSFELYVRQGIRSVSLDITEIEGFVMQRINSRTPQVKAA